MQHDIVSREEWLAARTGLLGGGEEAGRGPRRRGQAERRTLPWTGSTRNTPSTRRAAGRRLADLFDGRGRLIVYHFMFAPEWQDGCPGCSQRRRLISTAWMSICPPTMRPSSRSRARRLTRSRTTAGATAGASAGCRRSPPTSTTTSRSLFRPESVGRQGVYGFERRKIDRADLPGTSVFARNAAGEVFHAYSAYTNGGDMPLSLTIPPAGIGQRRWASTALWYWAAKPLRVFVRGPTMPSSLVESWTVTLEPRSISCSSSSDLPCS